MQSQRGEIDVFFVLDFALKKSLFFHRFRDGFDPKRLPRDIACSEHVKFKLFPTKL